MPSHVRKVEYARSFEVIEQAPGQFEHVIHDTEGRSIHGVGRLADVVARFREFLGESTKITRPADAPEAERVDLLGLDVVLSQIAGVSYPAGQAGAPRVLWMTTADGETWSITSGFDHELEIELHETLSVAQTAYATGE